MAIRQVVSRSIADGTIAAADIANTTITAGKLVQGAGGVGFFQGENGSRGDSSEYLIKKFIKKVKKSGLIQEVKNRRHYEKPSVAKRRKRKNKLKKSREITEKKKRF